MGSDIFRLLNADLRNSAHRRFQEEHVAFSRPELRKSTQEQFQGSVSGFRLEMCQNKEIERFAVFVER